MAKKKRGEYVGTVRSSDVEPYTALKWVGTMFKVAAIFLAVAVLGEFIAGLRFEGMASAPALLGELARTIVLAVLMWGGGDLVKLLIQAGNDIRAERILLARLVHRTPALPGESRVEETIEEATLQNGELAAPPAHQPPAGRVARGGAA
jgi:hypothetical protein